MHQNHPLIQQHRISLRPSNKPFNMPGIYIQVEYLGYFS